MNSSIQENTKIAWKTKADYKANRDNIRFNPNANLLAGGFGGICSLVVGFPFDTVKVRLRLTLRFFLLSCIYVLKITYQFRSDFKPRQPNRVLTNVSKVLFCMKVPWPYSVAFPD